MSRRRLIISAPRGSGGSYTHLAEVLPRIMDLRPEWDLELYAAPEVLQASFGAAVAPWMRSLGSGSYADRVQWEFRDLPRLLRRDPNALVWAPFGPPVNLALASRTVWMSRNIIPILPLREWHVSRVDRPRLLAIRALILLWARTARKTVCVSQDAKARLARLARLDPDTIPVIPHGVADADPQVRCSTRELDDLRQTPYLFYVGHPIAYRRTLELFRSYSEVVTRHRKVPPLVAAGVPLRSDAPYVRACLESIEPAMSRERARLLGPISHHDVLALMSTAHAFLYPSVHENCPNVVLEALAAGRVGVYADIAPVRELTGEAGLFVRDPGPLTLSDAIEEAAFNEPRRLGIAQQASQRAKLFTWARTAEATAAMLELAF